MIEATGYQIRKGLVSLTLQEKLLEFGDDTLEKVSTRLFEYYNCYLPDCYDNPLFLGKVLKELFDNSNIIIESLKNSLSCFVTQKSIAEFLDSLSMYPEQRTILCRGELN
jgi:hypothetical protein